jgi:hypothetical protein
LVRQDAPDQAADGFPGRITAAVTKTGKVTGKLEYLGRSHSFKTQLDPDLHAATAVLRRGDSSVALALYLNAVTDSLEVTAASANSEAPRVPKRLKSMPAALAGRYTVLLKPATGSPVQLKGSGFLALHVLPSGTISWTGKLQDTVAVKGSALLAPANDFAFYSPLYVPKLPLAGHIAGPLALTAAGPSGDLGWRKPPQLKGDYFRGGIAAILEPESSSWIVPARGLPVLAPGPMTFRFANAFSGISESTIQLSAQGKFTFPSGDASKPKLILNRTTGLLSGSFYDTFSGHTRTLQGAMLQTQAKGEGFAPGFGAIRTWELLPVGN